PGLQRSTIASVNAPLPQPTSSQRNPDGAASQSRNTSPASRLQRPIISSYDAPSSKRMVVLPGGVVIGPLACSCLSHIRGDLVLLGGVVARDDGARGLGRAEVDGLVRHVRRDEQEFAGLADGLVLEIAPPAGQHPAFQDVDAGLVADVRMRLGLRARR